VLAWTACEAALAARALGEQEPASAAAASVRAGYAATEARLRRWLWGGERPAVMARLRTARARVEQAAPGGWQRRPVPRALAAAVRRVPRRTAPLTPTLENTPEALAARLRRAGLDPWTLYWADGRRSIAEIAALAAGDRPGAKGGPAAGDWKQVLQRHAEFFAVHAELGYVQLMDPPQMWTRARLTGDLRRLGVRPGMDLMVHSSLSALGPVAGGAETVVAALLAAIGPRGTLLMPSFNHRAARVYNPLTTPTTNGAIPDAMWRRPDAVRSLHPTHAVAAIGPRAEHYCRGHVEAGVWAYDSPIGRLIHGGGYLLCLGTTHNTSTAYHVAEISMPCRCIDMFGADDVVVMPDGNLQRVRGLAFRAGPCPVPTSKLDETLDRRGLQRRGKVGQADSALCRAIDLWRVRREHLRGVCATCTVRPQRARG